MDDHEYDIDAECNFAMIRLILEIEAAHKLAVQEIRKMFSLLRDKFQKE